MKLASFLLLPSLVLQLFLAVSLRAADAASAAAGHWEGTITLPNTELGIRVDIERDAAEAWQGTIDIPQQGLRAFKLDGVKVDGTAVAFALPGIPGDPRFAGKLSADAKGISGDFVQGDLTVPFQLERKPKPAAEAREETPERGIPGKGLAGHWRGSLKPMPGIELRLALEFAAAADGKAGGTMVSLDQGNARVPLVDVGEKEGAVHFATPSIDGKFEGKFSADGSEIAGDWTQRGRSTPLVFKRVKASGAAGG